MSSTMLKLLRFPAGRDDGVSAAASAGRKRLMYIELKTGFNDIGPAWIGYVQLSKSGRTLHYRGKRLQCIVGGGGGGGSNYYDLDNGNEYRAGQSLIVDRGDIVPRCYESLSGAASEVLVELDPHATSTKGLEARRAP